MNFLNRFFWNARDFYFGLKTRQAPVFDFEKKKQKKDEKVSEE